MMNIVTELNQWNIEVYFTPVTTQEDPVFMLMKTKRRKLMNNDLLYISIF